MFAFDPFCTPKLQNVKIEQVMLARYYDFYLVIKVYFQTVRTLFENLRFW